MKFLSVNVQYNFFRIQALNWRSAPADALCRAVSATPGATGVRRGRQKPVLASMALALLLGFVPGLWAATDEVLSSEFSQLEKVGSGKLTWFGLTVYRAWLYAPSGEYRHNRPHAIKISYEMAFSRRQLAQATLDEMQHIQGELADTEGLLPKLENALNDVRRGDAITGVHYPGRGAEFYTNGELTGRLDDAGLAAAFFAIWLDPRTSEPALRTRLLGQDS